MREVWTRGANRPRRLHQLHRHCLLKTMLATSSHDRNNHPEDDYIAIAIDVHTAILHADIDQDMNAEPPEESELNDYGVWETSQCDVRVPEKDQYCGIWKV